MFDADDLIHRYSRAQALSDGVLIDVTPTAREAGFKYPVALTAGAWGEAVAWTERDTEQTGVPQDESGRLWDVLWMCRVAALNRKNHHRSRMPFTFLRVPRGGRRARRFTLDVMVGPGDDGEPVMTILLQDED